MKVDFLSLFDTLNIVARRIEVQDEELDLDLHPRSDTDEAATYLRRLRMGAIRNIYETSRAADLLGASIANASAEQRPKWFDVTLGRGTPWQSDEAGREGMALLAAAARWEYDYREAQRQLDQFGGSRWAPDASEHAIGDARIVDHVKMPRERQLGFDRQEILNFLITRQISNSLVSPHSAARERAQTLSAQDAAKNSASRQARPQFRGPLSEALKIAWQNARDRSDASSVFAELVKIARSESRMDPLTEATEDGQEVKWLAEDGTFKIFTVKDMRSRMRAVPKGTT
ncbi:hypothetical protein [Ralstonia pseudosolanacearum]|uniref:hypothetical protein n=1 Tax=Ralstonia pseudosolanacearum TaxID=1310165 RepID=UPI003865FA4A